MQSRNSLLSWSVGAVASVLVLSATGACSAQIPAGPAQTTRPAPVPTQGYLDDTVPPAVAGGTWTGTITIHGVIDEDKTEDGSSGDVGSAYYETYTKHDTTQTDVTDTYTITGTDPADVTFGISSVVLGGTAANAGQTLERYITTWKKQNSGCTWDAEDGTQTSGSWTGSGKAEGTLQLSEDGSYSIDIGPNITLPSGYEPDGPQLPYRNWEAITNLSAGCQGNGYDQTTTQGPIVWWVSSFIGELDVNDLYSNLRGQISGTPGTTIDGSITWHLKLPAMTMTDTWHLVHNSPIVLPHS